MKVLVIGSEAKDHALVWKLVQSERVSKVYCAPGNPGIAEIVDCIDIRPDNIEKLYEFAKEQNIDLTVVGSEGPLRLGICDLFNHNGLAIFGPDKNAIKLCSSKSFAKKFMYKNKIPTPKYGIFDKENAALDYIRKSSYPLVIKHDSHASTESVFICETFEKAKRVVERCFSSLIKCIVIENFIVGKELSFSVITDGYNALPLPASVSYKREFEGNGGCVTKGLGAYAPSEIVDYVIEEKVAKNIVFRALDALNNAKMSYSGILCVDMIIDEKNNLHVIDFNSNLTDPEAQTVLPLVDDDLAHVMYSTAICALEDDYEQLVINDDFSVTVCLYSSNPSLSIKEQEQIIGLDEAIIDDDIFVFQGQTRKNVYGEILVNGKKPLSITAIGSTLSRARDKAYEAVKLIEFKRKRYRKDIAKMRIGDKQNLNV